MRRNPPCLILPTDDAPREMLPPHSRDGPKMALSAVGTLARRRAAPKGVTAAAETADENPRGNAGMPTVLITGANRGLGLEFARQYATAGWRVIATSRAPDKADALHALGQRAGVHRLDAADPAAVSALGGALAAGASCARLEPEARVTRLRRVIARLARADSGRFYNYDGRPSPW